MAFFHLSTIYKILRFLGNVEDKKERGGGGGGGGMSNLFADLKTPRDGRMYD